MGAGTYIIKKQEIRFSCEIGNFAETHSGIYLQALHTVYSTPFFSSYDCFLSEDGAAIFTGIMSYEYGRSMYNYSVEK